MIGTNWRIKAFSIAFLLLANSCANEPQISDSAKAHEAVEYASNEYLIEAEELLKKLKSGSNLKLIDFRKPTEFNSGHIQSAVNIWRNQLEDTSYTYGGMMPTKVQLETLLGGLGISAADTIVIYDNKAEVDAARLWWVLKFYGHRNMKLLNGGLRSWMLVDSTLTIETSNIMSCSYTFETPVDSSVYASFGLVSSKVGHAGSIILDTRGKDEFTGAKLKNGAAWPGHIPSALNLDWAEAVDYNGNHKFLSVKELTSKYESIGIKQDSRVICYCHSGVRSAHTYFVLTELLGYKNVRNYDGSWTEWSHLNPKVD